MKKCLSIFLAFSILVSSLPESYVHAIGQLGNLVRHYQHHHHDTEREHQSLYNFLIDHYAAQHKDEDVEHHQDLPFHQGQDTTIGVVVSNALLPSPPQIVFIQILPFFKAVSYTAMKTTTSLSFFDDIWQPPRV